MEEEKNTEEIHFFIGICYLQQGNRKFAEVEFEKAHEIDNNYLDVLPYLADMKYFKGENEVAAEYLINYLESCPESKKISCSGQA